jgi:hypothetical protein
MMDRIQINGVWYVREDFNYVREKEREMNLTFSQTCTYETDEYCWEATRLYKDKETFYPDIDIKFTDKSWTKPWQEEYWDNNAWMKGVLEEDPESIFEAKNNMNDEGIADFRAFLKKLVELEWLTK